MTHDVSMQILMERMRKYADEPEEKTTLVVDLEPDDEPVDLKAGDDVDIEKLDETEPLPDDIKRKRKKEREKRADSKARAKAVRGDPFGWEDHLRPLSRGIISQKESKSKKKRTTNAIPGNPYHGRDGKFVDPAEDSGSWSLAVDGPHKSGRQSGQARRPNASKKQVFTKRRCGRGPDGVGKAKYKCKGGEVDEQVIIDEDKMSMDVAYLRGIIRQELMAVLKQYRSSTGGCTFNDLVRAQNIWSQSEKGDVGKPQK